MPKTSRSLATPVTVLTLMVAGCADFPTEPPPSRAFDGEWIFTFYADTAISEMCVGRIAFDRNEHGAIDGSVEAECANAFGDFTGTLNDGRISMALTMPCDPMWVPLTGTIDGARMEVMGRWLVTCQGVRIDYGVSFSGDESG